MGASSRLTPRGTQREAAWGRVYIRVLSYPDAGAGFRARPGLLPTIFYSKFDARGHARRVQDGQHDLAFTYDAAERLTQVAQADASGNPGTPVVTAFSYATANGASNWKNGKLETATAYNPDLTGASVVETYTYGGVAGRVSARQTQVEGRTINQSFAWTDLGPIGTLGYLYQGRRERKRGGPIGFLFDRGAIPPALGGDGWGRGQSYRLQPRQGGRREDCRSNRRRSNARRSASRGSRACSRRPEL